MSRAVELYAQRSRAKFADEDASRTADDRAMLASPLLVAALTRSGTIRAVAPPPLPSAGDPALLALANEFVYAKSGFYSPPDEDSFADDFVFRGPVIGPLCKRDYLSTLGTFGIYKAFPDISPNAFGYCVDPANERRVWFHVRNTGTHSGPLGLGFGISYPPTNKAAVGNVETFSLTFDEAGKARLLTVGYVADRFDEQANTGGSGAALGLMKAAGLVPAGFSSSSPIFGLAQRLGNAIAPENGPRTVSKPEDVPAWWPFDERGAEGS